MLNNSTFVASNNERDLSDRLLQTLYTKNNKYKCDFFQLTFQVTSP